MDSFLKQSTAAQIRWIGPFLDDTDFKTAETALTVANTDIKVSKNGGASASKNSGGGTHDVNGMYAVTWDATDTATVGELKYSVKVAGALPVFGSYVVVEEAVYDELFAASALGYVANAPVTLADAVAHGGTLGSSTATFALSRLSIVSQSANTSALTATGNGTGHGIAATSGAGATGNGINTSSGATNGHGLNIAGAGTGDGLKSTGGGTGHALELIGGGTSGDGLKVTTTSGHGFNIAATGTSKHGITATGGDGGTSDGIKGAAGTGGVDIRGGITGNITGNLSGSAGSVTGAVGSVTGAVGSVTGAVGSVTGAVGSVTGAVGSVTGAVGSVTGNVGGNVTGSVGSIAAGGIATNSFAAGAIDAAAIAADAIGSSELAATAATEIANAVAALAMTEPTAPPAVNDTLIKAISWLLVLARNKVTQTATTQLIKADDGATTIGTSTLSDDGTTFTRGEFA